MAVNPPTVPPTASQAPPAATAPPDVKPGFLDGLTARTLVFDVVGLGFTGATIYVGLVHGTGQADFGVFAALAGAYLGLKSAS